MVSIEEQETHISFGRNDDRAVIYTSDSTTMTKLDKMLNQSGTEWRLERVARLQSGEIVGKTYSCPKSYITFRSKQNSRTYTEEERRKIGERLRKINSTV